MVSTLPHTANTGQCLVVIMTGEENSERLEDVYARQKDLQSLQAIIKRETRRLDREMGAIKVMVVGIAACHRRYVKRWEREAAEQPAQRIELPDHRPLRFSERVQNLEVEWWETWAGSGYAALAFVLFDRSPWCVPLTDSVPAQQLHRSLSVRLARDFQWLDCQTDSTPWGGRALKPRNTATCDCPVIIARPRAWSVNIASNSADGCKRRLPRYHKLQRFLFLLIF